MKTSEKILSKQNEEAQKIAKERALVIDDMVQKVIDMVGASELTVNDFEVVIQQCLNGLKNVYLSHKVSDFIEKK